MEMKLRVHEDSITQMEGHVPRLFSIVEYISNKLNISIKSISL